LAEQAEQPPIAEHIETLRQLREQDLEPDPDGGKPRIRRGVAEDRRVSVTGVEFLRQHPEVELQLLPRSTPSNIVAEQIDVAIHVGRIVDSTLVVRRLATDSVVVVGSAQYLKKRAAPRSVEDLKEHNILRFSSEALNPQWRFRGRRSRPSLDLRGNFVASDAGAVRRAAALGLGLAMLPSFLVSDDVRAGRLVRVLQDTRLAETPISIVYAQRRYLPKRVRTFVDVLIQRFGTRKWREEALLVPKP
jgi:DNA-binding transcriptional LysR family regulator